MLKNKFKIIAILIAVILLLSVPFSFADDEENANYYDDETQIIENSEDNNDAENTQYDEYNEDDEATSTNSDMINYKKSDVYLADKDVKIDYVVDGNVFVVAENVTISSQIGGDAFICAKNITIEREGYIFSNLFAVGENITVNGVIYDGYLAADNISIAGYVYRDLKASSNNLDIFGTIGRNVFASVGNINLQNNNQTDEGTNEENADESALQSPTGYITGDLNYSSKNEITIPEDVVGGNVNYSKQISTNNTASATDYIINAISFLVLVAIIWLLSLWLAPKFLANTEKALSKKLLPVIGFGILGLILIPIISIVLMLLGLTSTFGLILMLIYVILIALSTSVFDIAVTNVLCTKLKLTKKIAVFGVLMGVTLVIWLLAQIPIVSLIINCISIILGLGIIIYNILPHKETTND